MLMISSAFLSQPLKSNSIMLEHLSRTQKSSNQNLLYWEMSSRSGSNLVLRVPINFYGYTYNKIYKLIVSSMYTRFWITIYWIQQCLLDLDPLNCYTYHKLVCSNIYLYRYTYNYFIPI
jgi:hypothetical protein